MVYLPLTNKFLYPNLTPTANNAKGDPLTRRFAPMLTDKVPHTKRSGAPLRLQESPPGLFHRHSGLQALACGKVSAGDGDFMSADYQNRSIQMHF